MELGAVWEKTLVISPHADDEVIGCGGLIHRLTSAGKEVHVRVVATGDIEFYHLNRVVSAEERYAELKDAMDYLNVNSYDVLFRSLESELDTIPIKDVIKKLDLVLQRVQPTAVLIPYPSFHQDHKVVFDASFAALRPSPGSKTVFVAMYEYPFISWSYESLNGGSLYVDISESLDHKIEALKKHKSQIREGRHMISPETVRLWAEKRGLEASIDYAEKYSILRAVM